MALAEKIVGRHFRYPDHYRVEREKVREYAGAVKNTDPACFSDEAAAELGYAGVVSPLTFISVFGYCAQTAFFADAGIGLTDKQIVQVDQALRFLKPGTAGDTLYCDVIVDRFQRFTGVPAVLERTGESPIPMKAREENMR